MDLSEKLSGVQKNIALKNHTTYKIGGLAKYFFIAKTKEDIIKAVETAKKEGSPLFVLGGGSNILFSDKGFNGIVIKINIDKLELKDNIVYTGAGVNLTKLAYLTTEKGLSGLQWAAGVPGTIGGAIYGHAQAFGVKISDIIKSVDVLDTESLKIKSYSKRECKFSLKNSIFKENKNLIILSAVLDFKKEKSERLKKQIQEFLGYRQTSHPLSFPSAGSIFVNPEVKIKDKELLERFPKLKEYNKKGVIPAGFLISSCQLAGTKIGQAQISEKHANFIVNLGSASSEEVMSLIKLVQDKVKKTFSISLVPEVQFVGF